MALIAFDGTWNKDESEVTQDTNVAHFRDEYDGGKVEYLKGVGTRFGWLGKLFGGGAGFGGEKRIGQALDAAKKFREAGDVALDVVGFSRGAALALDFCNELQDRYPVAKHPQVRVRFLALFDVVGSFGIPGNSANPFKDLRLADNVEQCCHAMALDESRDLFPLTRVKARDGSDAAKAGRLHEVWFRGVHSDVGGGNGKLGLSSLALVWMMRRAEASKVRFKAGAFERWMARRDADEALYVNQKMGGVERRRCYPSDVLHASVRRRAGTVDPLPEMSAVQDDGTFLAKSIGAAG